MLEQLRKKSKGAREQYAFWSALGVTGIIASLWLVSISVRLESDPILSDKNKEATGAFSQFYTEVRDNAASVFSSLRGSGTDDEPSPADLSEGEETVPVDNSSSSEAAKWAPKKPAGRPVLIATTSSKTATSSDDN